MIETGTKVLLYTLGTHRLSFDERKRSNVHLLKDYTKDTLSRGISAIKRKRASPEAV